MTSKQKIRSFLLPSRKGLICAFHSYFLKQNSNKSSPHKVPWLERPFLLWLPGIRVVSILDKDGVMSRLVERCSLSLECSVLRTALSQHCSFSISLFAFFSIFGEALSEVCALYQHFSAPLSFSHLDTDHGKSHSSDGSKRELMVKKCCTLYHIWTNLRAYRPAPLPATVDRRKGHNLTNSTVFQRDVAQCESSFRPSFFAWQRCQNYICLPAGGHPGFSLTLRLPFCSSRCWLDKNSSRVGRKILGRLGKIIVVVHCGSR